MPGQGMHSLRIVVQHLLEAHRSCYRVVAYGDRSVYAPLEFASQADVVHALSPILPYLDQTALASSNGADYSRIILTADVLVDDAQLQQAGLKP